MNIGVLTQIISSSLGAVRRFLAPLPGILMDCTCSSRPGFSSILTSAKIYVDMEYANNENDEIVKKFVFNVVDRIKMNIQDDGVCFVIIPPGEIKMTLMGANEGGPMVLRESPQDSDKLPSNPNFVFCWAIIR